jgi:hypothetical protein
MAKTRAHGIKKGEINFFQKYFLQGEKSGLNRQTVFAVSGGQAPRSFKLEKSGTDGVLEKDKNRKK